MLATDEYVFYRLIWKLSFNTGALLFQLVNVSTRSVEGKDFEINSSKTNIIFAYDMLCK